MQKTQNTPATRGTTKTPDKKGFPIWPSALFVIFSMVDADFMATNRLGGGEMFIYFFRKKGKRTSFSGE